MKKHYKAMAPWQDDVFSLKADALRVPAKWNEFHQSAGEEKGENRSTTSHPQSCVCHDMCNENKRSYMAI